MGGLIMLQRRARVLKVIKFAKVRHAFDDERLNNAYDIGFNRGVADHHYESRTFQTGAEYTAWLAGWRGGQVELHNRIRIARATEDRAQREARCVAEGRYRGSEGDDRPLGAVVSL